MNRKSFIKSLVGISVLPLTTKATTNTLEYDKRSH